MERPTAFSKGLFINRMGKPGGHARAGCSAPMRIWDERKGKGKRKNTTHIIISTIISISKSIPIALLAHGDFGHTSPRTRGSDQHERTCTRHDETPPGYLSSSHLSSHPGCGCVVRRKDATPRRIQYTRKARLDPPDLPICAAPTAVARAPTPTPAITIARQDSCLATIHHPSYLAH